MSGLAEFRAQYPQYNDMSDPQLAEALHKKFYSDMPREQFDRRIGLEGPAAGPAASPTKLFELDAHGRRYEVEAPSAEAALAALGLRQPDGGSERSPAGVRMAAAPRAGLFDDVPMAAKAPRPGAGLFDDVPDATPPIPPGFVLEKVGSPSERPGIPPIPPGFVLEKPAAAKPEKWDRATFLPLAVNEKNQGSLAVPGIVYEPYAAAKRLLSPEGQYRPGSGDGQPIKDAFEAASVAVPATRFPAVSREAVSRAVASEAANTRAFGPAKETGLENLVTKPQAEEIATGIPAARAADPGAAKTELLQAAERQAIAVPKYMASDSLIGKKIAGGLKDIPIVGDPIAKSTNRMAENIGKRVEGLAEDMAPNASTHGAGQTARDAMVDWIKNGSKIELEHQYYILDKLISKGTKVELSNTRKYGAELAIKDAESASGEGAKIINLVGDAIRRPGMTYEGLKELRTRIGDRLNGDVVDPGVSQKMLKGLYGALTKDLEQVIYRGGIDKGTSSGKRALAAWKEANKAAQEVYDRRERLGDIIGLEADRSPQRVFENIMQLASSSGQGDINRLHLARQTVGQDAWSEIAAAALNRMGLDKNGRFSPARFTTEYSDKKIAPAAKEAIFGKETKSALDDLARLSQEWETNQRFGNPSGTGRAVSVMAGIGSAWANPMWLVAEIGTGFALARLLSRPATAKAAANWAMAYKQRAAHPSAGMELLVQQSARKLAADLADTGGMGEDDACKALSQGGRLR